VIQAFDHDEQMFAALIEEMGEPEQNLYTTFTAPSKQIRVEWMIGSGGDLAIELCAEKTTLIRDPRGNYTIKNQNEQPTNAGTNSTTANDPAVSATAITSRGATTPVSTANRFPGTAAASAIALFS
jgi:hypothetical protein